MKRSGLLVALAVALHFIGVRIPPVMAQEGRPQLEVLFEDHHDVTRPLKDIEPALRRGGTPREIPLHLRRLANKPHQKDPVVQRSKGAPLSTTAGANILGVGAGFTGPQETFPVDAAPPDPNGAVGVTQFVHWVNESFAVFDKATGAVLHGPVAGNTLWSGFGGGCETNNDGDPIVAYNKAADRWVTTQLSVSTTPYLQCVAVLTSSDATGAWYRYAFQMPNFPDYPNLAVWPDAYYMSFNRSSRRIWV